MRGISERRLYGGAREEIQGPGAAIVVALVFGIVTCPPLLAGVMLYLLVQHWPRG